MSTNVLTNQHPTPNTEEPKSSCNLLTCHMKIGFLNPKVKSVEAEKLINSTFKIATPKGKRVSADVFLIRDDYVDPLKKQVSSIRTFFNENTITLGKSKGVRGGTSKIIPAKNFFRVVDYWTESKAEFDFLVHDFLSRWESEIRPNSWEDIKDLGVTLTAKQQEVYSLSSEDIQPNMYYIFDQDGVAPPHAVRNMAGLTDQLRLSLEKDFEQKQSRVAQEAHKELKERLNEVVVKLRDKMISYDPAANKRMSDSIITNIEKLVCPDDKGNNSLIEDLCVGNGKELDEILELADDARLLCSYEVEDLKGVEGETLRREVAKEAGQLLNKIEGGNTADAITNMMKF